jgi:flagellar hook-basal body complex protein FliE
MPGVTFEKLLGTLTVPELPTIQGNTPTTATGKSFSEYLKSAIENVNDLQDESDRVVKQFLAGEGPDIHTVVLAANKADLSFQMMMQIRNKLVQAYQEIMRIQV